MKKILNMVKMRFANEIAFAKESGFKGVLLPTTTKDESIYLELRYSVRELEEMAIENGWDDKFVYLDFVTPKEQVYFLDE